MSFRCPVCSDELCKKEKVMLCPNGHSFDIAAKGYVNLLLNNSSGAKRHGDDRLMINARRDFLSKGFYEPLERHLWELKAAVYDEPYENEVPPAELEGFTLEDSRDVAYEFSLESNRDITDLFNMTPYCYKTSQSDREKLEKLETLSVSASFRVLVYRKNN